MGFYDWCYLYYLSPKHKLDKSATAFNTQFQTIASKLASVFTGTGRRFVFHDQALVSALPSLLCLFHFHGTPPQSHSPTTAYLPPNHGSAPTSSFIHCATSSYPLPTHPITVLQRLTTFPHLCASSRERSVSTLLPTFFRYHQHHSTQFLFTVCCLVVFSSCIIYFLTYRKSLLPSQQILTFPRAN